MALQIADEHVVSIHYTLTNTQGEVLDSSDGQEPLTYIQGKGNIIDGLEAAMLGHQVGDKFDVKIAPEQGYGVRDEDLVQNVPRSMFRGIDEIEAGMQFQAQTPHGPQIITVRGVEGDQVKIDGNHPLAGETLCFHVEVTEIRAATKEELAHGHTHAEGGCCGHDHGGCGSEEKKGGGCGSKKGGCCNH
jgi:FKBP-type peptidyl-prolyl cis-trans isomerase SlyD